MSGFSEDIIEIMQTMSFIQFLTVQMGSIYQLFQDIFDKRYRKALALYLKIILNWQNHNICFKLTINNNIMLRVISRLPLGMLGSQRGAFSTLRKVKDYVVPDLPAFRINPAAAREVTKRDPQVKLDRYYDQIGKH